MDLDYQFHKQEYRLSDEQIKALEETQRKSSQKTKPTLCLDFDGVLHWYRNGWQGPTIIDDDAVPGAQEFVRRARESFEVIVYSSRCVEPGGKEAIVVWLVYHGFPALTVTDRKPAAFLTIDDRALTFDGRWPDPSKLLEFRPWMARE